MYTHVCILVPIWVPVGFQFSPQYSVSGAKTGGNYLPPVLGGLHLMFICRQSADSCTQIATSLYEDATECLEGGSMQLEMLPIANLLIIFIRAPTH